MAKEMNSNARILDCISMGNLDLQQHEVKQSLHLKYAGRVGAKWKCRCGRVQADSWTWKWHLAWYEGCMAIKILEAWQFMDVWFETRDMDVEAL